MARFPPCFCLPPLQPIRPISLISLIRPIHSKLSTLNSQLNLPHSLKTSLIISALDFGDRRLIWLTLRSVFNQRMLPDEIIVCAVDPSFEFIDTVEEMSFESFAPVRTCFISAESVSGPTALVLMKEGGEAAEGDYLIFVTSGTILHPAFIVDHLALACGEPVAGPAAALPADISSTVYATGNLPSAFSAPSVPRRRSLLMKPLNRILRLIGRSAGVPLFPVSGASPDATAANNFALPASCRDSLSSATLCRPLRFGAVACRLGVPPRAETK